MYLLLIFYIFFNVLLNIILYYKYMNSLYNWNILFILDRLINLKQINIINKIKTSSIKLYYILK